MVDGYYSYYSQASGLYDWPATGTIQYPQQSLQIVDPTINAIASFFTQLLNTNLLPRFTNECVACGLTNANLDSFIDGTAVAQTVVFPLNEELLKINEFRFPLLAVQPMGEHFTNLTLAKNVAVERQFKVAYILPPLTGFQYNRLYPFLGMASKTILDYGMQGFDPKVSNTSIWNQIGVSFGYFEGSSYEPYDGLNKTGGHAYFPTVEMDIAFVERNQNPVPINFKPFTSIQDLQIDLYDGYSVANPIPTFIAAPIFPNISITSCTPNSGSIQGNTLIVLQGLGFENVRSITICGSPVVNYALRSPTVIQAITTPVVGYSASPANAITGNIVMKDQFDNQYTLTNGFSYTYP